MANDALFQMLAQAKGQPSKALRAVQSAGQAGQDILGGYMQGKELGQQMDTYRLLSTPLGSMYPDPSQIPFGLSPSHTVKDLLTIAPAMSNYVPSNLIKGAAQSFGASTTDNGPSIPQVASTNPSPSIGDTGTPIANPSSQPGINVPAGGMGLKAFQDVVLPTLKAGQEERHFQTNQANEESRFARGKMAGAAETASKNLSTTGSIQDDINNLRQLFKGYNPTPFLGGAGAKLAAASGSPTFGTPTMQQGNAIQQVAPALGAKINYELTRRFSPGESQLLMNNVVPSANDNEANATMKLNNLQRLVAVFQSGDQASINMVASAIAGRLVTAQVPTSIGTGPSQTPPNAGTGDPEADAAIQRIQSSNLNPQAKQARINAVRARMRPRGTF